MNGSFLGFGPGHWGLGLVIWLLIIVGFVAIYFAIRKNTRHEGSTDGQSKTALEILQARYANGEIDEDEFIKKKRMIEK